MLARTEESRSPWIRTADGTQIEGPHGRVLTTSRGVRIETSEHQVDLPWSDVYRLRVSLPTEPMWLWLLLAPIFFMVPAALIRVPDVDVIVSTRQRKYQILLGRPAGAPYSRRVASATDSLCARLSDRGRLGALADPRVAAELIEGAAQGDAKRVARMVDGLD